MVQKYIQLPIYTQSISHSIILEGMEEREFAGRPSAIRQSLQVSIDVIKKPSGRIED